MLADLDMKCYIRNEKKKKKVGRTDLSESMFIGSLEIGFFSERNEMVPGHFGPKPFRSRKENSLVQIDFLQGLIELT